ncbi:hypothetical protein [Endozoicomonas sp. YOMI1]|uniref:hypothetical protein n=1 Tax=Endozoicomonas sp. YOMI1 TaxID=2828739 RepID=UPI00214969F8|nr:hypothetical protein [Endozoicomonas sp. YOMI1]
MDPGRAQLSNIPGLGVSSQARELRPLTNEIIERRLCGLCAEYIECPPFMASRCCGDNYHYGCTVVMTREVAQCSVCKKTPVEFARDTDFAEEVKKYDWSLFEPASAAGGYAPIQAFDSESASEQAGSIGAVAGPSGLSGNRNQQAVDVEEVERALAQLGTFVQQGLGAQELVPPKAPHPFHPPLLTAAQTIARPSLKLNIVSMTRTFERLLGQLWMPDELQALAGQSGYSFLRQMMDVGVVPGWQELCAEEDHLCGKQMNIDKSDDARAFFTAMQQHLDQLAPEHQFFVTFACSRQNPVTGCPEPVSPVVRIFRHPTEPRLIFLFTVGEPVPSRALGRLVYGSFASGTQLVKYLQFLMLVSEATQAIFVRPTKKGESDAEGLDKIDVKAFVQQYPPRDFGLGDPSKNNRRILLYAARSLGLQRIRKEDAEKVTLLNNMIEGDLRNSQLTVKNVIDHILGLGYRKKRGVHLLYDMPATQMPGLHGRDLELNRQMINLQNDLADVLIEMYNLRATSKTDYILIELEPEVFTLPEEILVLVLDTDRLYLVNMKNRSVSVQCSSSIDDICDFCQVFMSGCQILKANIISYAPTQTKKSLAES